MPHLIGVCILKVVCHLKANVWCLSERKTKIMSFHYYVIYSKESLVSDKWHRPYDAPVWIDGSLPLLTWVRKVQWNSFQNSPDLCLSSLAVVGME